jgi:hypothetical protein
MCISIAQVRTTGQIAQLVDPTRGRHDLDCVMYIDTVLCGVCVTNTNKIYMNHSQRHRDYLDKDYDSLATTHGLH